MRLRDATAAELTSWKSPLQVRGPASRCCTAQTVLRWFSSGGFIKTACMMCGKLGNLPQRDFERLRLGLKCGTCGGETLPRRVGNHYTLVCQACQQGVDIAALLPPHTEKLHAPWEA